MMKFSKLPHAQPTIRNRVERMSAVRWATICVVAGTTWLMPADITNGQLPANAENPAAESAEKAVVPTEDQIEQLTKLLTNSRWTGRFTKIKPDGSEGKAVEESYDISTVKKMSDSNVWLLTARIKYGKRDVTVPLPIEILWAGGTPVMTVDQLLVPGLGTFDARVLIRRGKYSGTWSHNEVGGHLFGVIGRAEQKDEIEPASPDDRSNE